MHNKTVSLIVTIALVVVALGFAVLGFLEAPNSQIAPMVIAAFMLVSAAAFVGLAALGLTRDTPWQRFLGVAAVLGALYMMAMAAVFFNALSRITTEFLPR